RCRPRSCFRTWQRTTRACSRMGTDAMAAPFRHRVAHLLGYADVQIGGTRPWDLQVHQPRFFRRVLGQGSLGLGESYMDGDWDTGSLDGLLSRLMAARVDERVTGFAAILDALRARLMN